MRFLILRPRFAKEKKLFAELPRHTTLPTSGQRSGPLQPSADALGSRERAAPESFLGRADLRTYAFRRPRPSWGMVTLGVIWGRKFRRAATDRAQQLAKKVK